MKLLVKKLRPIICFALYFALRFLGVLAEREIAVRRFALGRFAVDCDIIIRSAELRDLERLADLERRNGALCYSAETLKSLLEDDSVVLVAEAARTKATLADKSGSKSVALPTQLTQSTKPTQPAHSDCLMTESEISVAKAESEIVGYAAVSVVFEDADIINIAVEKEWRRCGIGGILISEAARRCVRLGAKRVLLEVSEDNAPAISFYQELGFEQIFLRPKYYGELSAVIMQLTLNETD